ncbi:hypothetical protein P691DRAFT_810164 [Macrolepiota fuliginosa MF-IS2]|uniref:Uncharacterized protein n=1 Tax=Macrolepiota fuliginosa MF-IS2 TaxID=1400762 RepID=A0A9P5X1U3_9AGAR|nr:hypothetical protein P691DRAFT_810164 [Macrolepiota fuliginosa MF-IS2]
MALKDGLYTIRHLAKGQPPIVIGGMYASSKDGKDKPVTAEPLGPDSKIRWIVTCVPGKENEYTITELRDDNSIPGQWARETNALGRPVMLIAKPNVGMFTLEWGIQETEEPGVYNIRGDSRIGATDWADLRDPGGVRPEVLLESVPVVPDMYIPRWVFEKA